MASKPGILTDWPWKPLGNFKYQILAPWVVHSIHSYFTVEKEDRDLVNLLITPFMLWRVLHNQLWISYSRYRNAKGNNIIIDKSLDFEQVDRESNWDDQIVLMGILYYMFNLTQSWASRLPIWRWDGIFITTLLHMGPVEFLYYWFHRALHHHYLYSRYHSHHHSSIVTQPITSVIHPFAENVVYFILFAIPLLCTSALTGTASLASIFGYVTYIDFMNNMGHCNFEVVPPSLFSIFPPLKYLMYTPSYHSLHHTQFRTNYSLFMPFYDYIYGTMDNSTDSLYQTSLQRPQDLPDIVHLTHLTTFESIYHLRLGFASFASNPQTTRCYFWLMSCPFTLIFTWFNYGRVFISDRHALKNLKLQSWVVPRYNFQYFLSRHREAINNLIEEAIKEADNIGVKVLSLGLLNQGEELNKNGELYIERNPKLKIKLVDGTSLVVAVVLNIIPRGATQVLFTGKLSKVAYALASALCQRGIQVATLHQDHYNKLKLTLNSPPNLVLTTTTTTYDQKIWLVGDGMNEQEQLKASKGTSFIPFSLFPLKKVRKDCCYFTTPAMLTPPSLHNMYSCENWLPRRVMSAWRVAGIVHALEEWNVHECGHTMFNIDKVWKASLHHGFRPLVVDPSISS